MIEILLIIALCRAIGRLLRAKGRRPGGYQVLAVVLWLVGEVSGIVAGQLLELGWGMYVMGWMGAACGAGAAYAIASLVKPVRSLGSALGPVFD